MATIRKKGDAQWHVQIRRKHITETKTFTTKVDAEKWARDVESQIDRNVYISSKLAQSTSFGQACDRYEKEILPSKKGFSQDVSRLHIVKLALGHLPLAAITGTHLSNYRDHRLNVVGNQTVIHELNLVNRIFKSCLLDWHIHLPAGIPLVRKPTKPVGRERNVEQGEIDAILGSTESLELSGIVCLALETAMRREELTRLTWVRLDFSKRVFKLFSTETKNGEGRGIPLSTTAIDILKQLPRRIDGRVFSLKKDSITQAFVRAVSRARSNYLNECNATGVEANDAWLVDLRFHDLRHAATSRLAEKIPNVIELASITGHKDLQTLKRYYHPKAEDLAKKLA
jgi:integrase